MNLDYATLRANQLKTRSIQQDDSIKIEPILVGDTVSVKNKTEKHKANEIYIAVGKEGEKLKMQKILKLLERMPLKLMSNVYQTNEKRLKMIHGPELIEDENNQFEEDPAIKKHEQKMLNSINQNFFSPTTKKKKHNPITLCFLKPSCPTQQKPS